jgi:Lon protease-like protein
MLVIITSFYKVRQSFVMNQQAAVPQKTRSEQETENEANRLKAQVEAALAAVAVRSPGEDDLLELESAADRIERVARDLTTALRGLAQERKANDDES